MEETITLQQAWELQYRNNPYLRKLSVDGLFGRVGDLMTISMKDLRDGKMSYNQDRSIMERYIHALEECKIRGLDVLDYEGPIKTAHLPKANSPKVRRAMKKIADKKWPDSILVKFGTREHMASLFLEGKGRVSLAKTYNDPSLGQARADDESRISFYIHPDEAHRLFGVPNGSRMVDLDVPFLGSVQIDFRAPTDYYVYCMAQACDIRLFDDFTSSTSNVTACVVIKEPEEFVRRLSASVSGLLVGWPSVIGPVTYYDPFFVHVNDVVPFTYKHFRFQYQKEHRFIWLPSRPEHSTLKTHVEFEIGPLTDCAEFIWLKR